MNSVCSIISNPEQYLSKSYLTYIKNSLESLVAYAVANGGHDYTYTPEGTPDYLFLKDLEEANGDYVEAIDRKFARLNGLPKKSIRRNYILPKRQYTPTLHVEVNGETLNLEPEGIHLLLTGKGCETLNFTIFNKVGLILAELGYTESFIQKFIANNSAFYSFRDFLEFNLQKLKPSENIDTFAERLAEVVKKSFLQVEQEAFQKSEAFNPLKVSIKNQVKASESTIESGIDSFYATLTKKGLIHSWSDENGKVWHFLSLKTKFNWGKTEIDLQERAKLIEKATERLYLEIKRLGLPKNIISIKTTRSGKSAYVTINPDVFGTLQDDIAGGMPIADKQIIDNLRRFLEKKFNIKSQEIRVKDLPEFIKDRKDYKNINAFIQDNTVYLVKDRYNADTIIEEFLHPFVNTLYNLNRAQFNELYQEAATLFPQLRLQIEHDYRNVKEYNQDDLKQELVAQALSRHFREEWENLLAKNSTLTTADVLSDLGKAESFWQKAWKFIKGLFKFDTSEFENLTLRDFARLLNASDSEFSLAFTNKRWYNLIDIFSFKFHDGTEIKTPFQLNDLQKLALWILEDFLSPTNSEKVITLSGYAGTGKTSLMEIIAQKCKQDNIPVRFSASTNKAAAVLQEKVSKYDFEACTLNKLFGIQVEVDSNKKLYDAKDLTKFIDNSKIRLSGGEVIIIDEASMIDDENYDWLKKYAQYVNSKLIFVGDPGQLPPVKLEDLSKVFRTENGRVITLTQVERTGDNAILKEATALRNGKSLSGETSLNDAGKGVIYIEDSDKNEIDLIIRKFSVGLQNDSNYFRILTYTNNSVEYYNTKVREALGYTTSTPQAGEPMMGYANWGYDWKTKSYRFINSEAYKVIRCTAPKLETVWLGEDSIQVNRSWLTLQDSFGAISEFPFIDVKYDEQNKTIVTQLAQKKLRIWDKIKIASKNEKALLYQLLRQYDAVLFINADIKGSSGNTLLPKVIDFGYAMTIHKSLGSTFKHVLLDDANIESGTKYSTDAKQKLALKYVGVSRATDTVTVISSGMKKEGSSLPLENIIKEDKITSKPQAQSISAKQKLDQFRKNGIFYSGGAKGADLAWARELEKLGLKVRNYGVEDYDHISPKEKLNIESAYKDVVKALGRKELSEFRFIGKVVRSSYLQVANADSVYAISTFDKSDHVSGGTAYAVEYARWIGGKPIYFYDLDTHQWYYAINNEAFTPMKSLPQLTEKAAVIGTRGKYNSRGADSLGPEGIQAIKNVIINTFDSTLFQKAISEQLISQLKSSGVKVYGKAAMAEYLKTYKLEYLQQAIEEQKEMDTIKQKAIANGTFMKAPNGKPTNLTERQWLQVRTTNFKNWFGDWENDPANASKIVDGNGEPLVVYHGGDSDIRIFDRSKTKTASRGFFFTVDKNVAKGYGNVTEVFLNIKNLLENDSEWFVGIGPVSSNNPYDGEQYFHKDAEAFIVWNPNQIKSAIVNNGNFSLTDNDIQTFATSEGEVYGFVDKEGNIYLDETVISPEHPIHEYTHLWDRVVAEKNPALWKRGVELMKLTSLWNEIYNDSRYGKKWLQQNILGERLDNLIASEVHARLTGKKGNEILNNLAKSQGSENIISKLKTWILNFWKNLKTTFNNWSLEDLNNLTLDDFNRMTLRDFTERVNLKNILALKKIEFLTAPTINIYAGANEHPELSNFALRPFNHVWRSGNVTKFLSVEQAFQYAKALMASDSEAMIKILRTTQGALLRHLGREVKDLNAVQWDRFKESFMKVFIKESFEQNPQALQQLLATGNAILTHNQDLSEWKYLFPKILMEVRGELKNYNSGEKSLNPASLSKGAAYFESTKDGQLINILKLPIQNKEPKMFFGQMTFDYDNYKRSNVSSTSTFDAIINGERTATTRFAKDGHIEYWQAMLIGDRITFKSKDEKTVIVEVTKPLTKLDDNVNPDEWSKKEGWSIDYFNKFVKPRISEAYLFEYKYIEDNASQDSKSIYVEEEKKAEELSTNIEENTGFDPSDLTSEDLYIVDFLLYVEDHSDKSTKRLIDGYIKGDDSVYPEIEALLKLWLQREQELLHLKRWNTSTQVKQLPNGHWDFESYFKGIDITKPINELLLPEEYGQIQNFSVKPAEIIAPKKYRANFLMGRKTLLELDSPEAFMHNDQWYASPLELDGIASDFLIRTHNSNISIIITDSLANADEKSSIYTPVLQKNNGEVSDTFIEIVNPNVKITDEKKETKITRKISLAENRFGSFLLDQSLKTGEFTLRFVSENSVKISDLSQEQLNFLTEAVINSLPVNAKLSLSSQATLDDLAFIKTFTGNNFRQIDEKVSALKTPKNKNIIKQTDDNFITDLKGNKLCDKPAGNYEVRNYLGHTVIVLENNDTIKQDLINIVKSMNHVVSIQPLLENYMFLDPKNAKEITIKLLHYNTISAHNDAIFQALLLSPNLAIKRLKSVYTDNAELYQKEYANVLYNSFKRTLKLIAARIPTQAFQSFMEMLIVDFYETERNDTFVSRWQLWLLGSDLDIDKVYMLLFGVDEKGFLESWSKIADYRTSETSEISNELPIPNQTYLVLENDSENPKFRNKIISISENPTEIGVLVQDWLNTYDKTIQKTHWSAKYKKSSLEAIRLEIVRQILEEFNRTGNFDITFEEFSNPKIKKLISIINRHNLTPLTEEASKNLVLRSIHKVITDPRNYVSSYSPIDEAMNLFLDKIKYLDDKTITHSYDDGFSIFEALYDNSVGKDDVGIMANGLKAFFNLTLYFNHFYKYNKDQIDANSHKYFLRGFELYEHGVGNNIPTFKSTISDTQLELDEIRILNETLKLLIPEAYEKGARIATSNNDASLLISALVSLATDNAKTLALSKLKAGLELASMHIYMVTMGFSSLQIIDYIKTPVFSKLVELVLANIFNGHSGRIERITWLMLYDWAGNDSNKIADVQALENLYYSAQELTQLARSLGINLGLKADDTEIANTCFKFKNMLKNVVKRYQEKELIEKDNLMINALIQNHGLSYSSELYDFYREKYERVKLILAKNNMDLYHLEIDMNKYFSDESYRNDIVEIYDLFKETFNLYDVINNSPNYYQMFNALNTHLNVLTAVSVKSRISLVEGFEFYNPKLINASKKGYSVAFNYGIDLIKSAKRFVDDYIISDFLRTNSKIPFKIKTSNWELSVNFLDINAIKDFTNFVNSKLIPQLKQSYLDNVWLLHMQLNLKKVREARDKQLGETFGEYILNFNLDKLNPKSQDALIAKLISDDFNKLADLKLSDVFSNSEITGNNLSVADVLYLYNLIIKNNNFGQNSLTPLFDKYCLKQDSLFTDWLLQVLDFDLDKKSIEIDPVLFTAYLNKYGAIHSSKAKGNIELQSELEGKQIDVKVPLINMPGNLNYKNDSYEYLELLRELINNNIIVITKKC